LTPIPLSLKNVFDNVTNAKDLSGCHLLRPSGTYKHRSTWDDKASQLNVVLTVFALSQQKMTNTCRYDKTANAAI
jgi:hypothetical protein